MPRNAERKPLSTTRAKLYAALEAERGSAYVLRLDLSVEYLNRAGHLSLQNGAPDLVVIPSSGESAAGGCRIPPDTAFVARFQRLLQRNEAWFHSYAQPSTAAERRFNLHARPTAAGDGLLVVHSLAIEKLAGDEGLADSGAHYIDSRGLIVQCSACTRVRSPSDFGWVWAPDLVSGDRQNVSHGMCPTCEFQYYG